MVPGAGIEPARLSAGDFESLSEMAQPRGLQLDSCRINLTCAPFLSFGNAQNAATILIAPRQAFAALSGSAFRLV